LWIHRVQVLADGRDQPTRIARRSRDELTAEDLRLFCRLVDSWFRVFHGGRTHIRNHADDFIRNRRIADAAVEIDACAYRAYVGPKALGNALADHDHCRRSRSVARHEYASPHDPDARRGKEFVRSRRQSDARDSAILDRSSLDAEADVPPTTVPWRHRGVSDGDHARHSAEPLRQRVHELFGRSRGSVAGLHVEKERRLMPRRRIAEIRTHERYEGAREQSGADDEHDGKRDLGRHECARTPRGRSPARRRAATAVAERVSDVKPRRAQAGNQSERQSARCGECDCEHKYTAVDTHVTDVWKNAARECEQYALEEKSESDADRSSDDDVEQTHSEHLSHQAAA